MATKSNGKLKMNEQLEFPREILEPEQPNIRDYALPKKEAATRKKSPPKRK